MKKLLFAIVLFAGVLTLSCSSSKKADSDKKTTSSKYQKEEFDGSLSLEAHLRKHTGVTIRGAGQDAQVIIRGTSSMNGDNEAVFVVNGRLIEGGLRSASQIVPVAEIKSIKVLKPGSQTAIYGIKGANGVVEIKLKGN